MALVRMTVRTEKETGGDGGWLVRSPALGRLIHLAGVGSYLDEGVPAGVLRVLRRDMELALPETCRGVMIERLVTGTHCLVQCGQPLFRLGTGAGAETIARRTSDAVHREEETEVPAGMLAIRSPTDGVFYRRPSPEAPPYVEEGSAVEPGAVLGLVEVMKCFHQILFGRDTEAPGGTIHRILAKDTGEVHHGDILFLVDLR